MVLDHEEEGSDEISKKAASRRPQMKDSPTPEMIKSYRCCMLLAPQEELSTHLRRYLIEQADIITREVGAAICISTK